MALHRHHLTRLLIVFVGFLAGCRTTGEVAPATNSPEWQTISLFNGAATMQTPVALAHSRVPSPSPEVAIDLFSGGRTGLGISVQRIFTEALPVHDAPAYAFHMANYQGRMALSAQGFEVRPDAPLQGFPAFRGRGELGSAWLQVRSIAVGQDLYQLVFHADKTQCQDPACEDMATRFFQGFQLKQPKPAPYSGPQTPKAKQAFLWKVEGNGLKEPSWLFGTIHMGISFFDVPVVAHTAFREADSVVGEADILNLSSADVMHMASLPPGTRLQDEIRPATYEKLKIMFPTMPKERFETLSPAFFAMSMPQRELVAMTMQHEIPDRYVQIRARLDGRPIHFLETAEAQWNFLKKVYDGKALDELVEDPAAASISTKVLLEKYYEGDPAALWDSVSEALTPKERKYLFQQRNRAWLPKLEAWMKKNSCFIATGVGHFVGPDSVVTLLRKKGYRVTFVGTQSS